MLIITVLLMIIIISASIALSIRTIQKAIDRESQIFEELIEEHAIQVY
jgi:hypothetical protein